MLFKKCLNIYKLFIRYIADIPMLYENYKEIKKKKINVKYRILQ